MTDPEICHIDFESRSTVDLLKTGASVYAQHPTTDIWCLAFAFGDEDIELIPFEDDGNGGLKPPDNDPRIDRIIMHILEGGLFYAHNAAFERLMWKHICAARFGWPDIPIKQWRCTMAMCYALALPGALKNAAPAAGIKEEKDAAGSRLMKQMAKPRKRDPLTWWDTPEKKERHYAYCKQDVKVERMLERKLKPLPRSEQYLWFLDQKINDRGVYVDQALCHAAKKVVAATREKLDARMSKITEFSVTACSNRNQLFKWVKHRGIEADSIAKDKIEELLGGDLPKDVRAALETRLEANKTSVAKIDALLRGTDPDGRARHLLQFHAATTGRWGGRRFQPQNLKRPTLKGKMIDDMIDMLMAGDVELIEMLYDEPLSAVGDALRGMVTAAPGKKLVAADYSNIEGRVLAWLAGEETKLDAFRDFDAGKGADIYKLTAGGILNKQPADITDNERQAYGKVPELALGFQGGVGAFQTMAVNYGVNLPEHEVEQIRDGWRATHPCIVDLWRKLNEAAIEAVRRPGNWYRAGEHLALRSAGTFLYMRLPSGRLLAYANPRIGRKKVPWTDRDGNPVYQDAVFFFGVNSYTRKWEEQDTYGGKLAENGTQAVARDVMAHGMWNAERAGYWIVLHVHDDGISEVDIDFGSPEEFSAALCDLPEWADGLPVSAEGWEGKRYRK